MPKRVSKEEFIERSIEKHGNKYNYYKLNYIKIADKVEIICNIHKKSFFQRANDHLQGHGCPLCKGVVASKLKRRSKEEFIYLSNIIFENRYDYSEVKYINSKTPITIICNQHGKFTKLPNAHISQKQGCKLCSNNTKKITIESFISRSINIHGNIYDYSQSTYDNMDIKLKIICEHHGVFYQTPHIHLSGSGCPKCMKSHKEDLIEKILLENNIKYTRQKSFDDCRGIKSKKYIRGKPLPFDFHITDYNLLIEFDGIYHFSPLFLDNMKIIYPKFHTNKRYLEGKYRDDIKTKYCNDNNIPLLRIPFYEYEDYKEKILKFIKDFRN